MLYHSGLPRMGRRGGCNLLLFLAKCMCSLSCQVFLFPRVSAKARAPTFSNLEILRTVNTVSPLHSLKHLAWWLLPRLLLSPFGALLFSFPGEKCLDRRFVSASGAIVGSAKALCFWKLMGEAPQFSLPFLLFAIKKHELHRLRMTETCFSMQN